MAYTPDDTVIPFDRRADINAKILHIIESGQDHGITHEDIYNAYTGDGGLHGLHAADFDNFHEYTEAKKEIEVGQFFTPHVLCKFLIDCIRPSASDMICDLTCGMGNFYNWLPNLVNVYGCELDIKAYKVARYLYPQANLECTDIRYYRPDETFDLILGNPPFNLQWGDYVSQLYYCIKSAELLRPGGILALIVPSSYMADEFMDGGVIREMDARYNFVLQMDLPVDAFKRYGVDRFSTKMMIFQRRSEHIEHAPYSTRKIDATDASAIHATYIQPVIEQRNAVRHKLFFERLHADTADREWSAKVTKWLYGIKQNPRIRQYHARAVDYVNKYYTQVKPDDMKPQEWEQKRIKKGQVSAYLQRIVRNQHVVERDEIRLVKTDHGLKLKAYSAKTRRQLSKLTNTHSASFANMVTSDNYPFEDRTYRALCGRKRSAYEHQDIAIKELQPQPHIDDYLRAFTLNDASNGEALHLNDMQRADLNLVMQKRYAVINWQMGSGKTLAGIAWYKYLLDNKRVRNVFVVSAALAINLTWAVKLRDYGEDFTVIRRLSDIDNIKPGQVVLITFNALVKYRRQIQKFVRMQSQKVAIVVDESDELTNHSAKRTKAALACFRRVRYKLLTTGTTTRNNINELYPQIELLYNNSVNMLCECSTAYKTNRDNEIVDYDNEYYMEPFPAHGGQSLWKACFCPSKATVFGIRKFNQDIYNMDALQHVIEKTIITRKFAEIVGEKKYDIITHRISQNDAERAAYVRIMKEFHSMCARYYRSTGNSRKDAMLMLIRQIQLMIKSTSTPHLLDEYESSELPNKFGHVVDMLKRYSDEKVAIGCVFVDSVDEYARVVRDTLLGRPVFVVKGDIPFRQRGDVISQFEDTTDGILISTQQALKSSVNIPTCNKVIVESMQWNLPKISQYFFRFIRFNSTQHKEIHFVTYDYTIEQNLLALLMTKERINEYIKTLEFRDESDIFAEYDIDMNIFDAIIEKERDEEGHIHLTWGRQDVI